MTSYSAILAASFATTLAGAAIASDQVLTLNPFSPAGFDVLHGRNHGIWTLNKLFERNAESCIDGGFHVDCPLQYRLNGDLGDPHWRLHGL